MELIISCDGSRYVIESFYKDTDGEVHNMIDEEVLKRNPVKDIHDLTDVIIEYVHNVWEDPDGE